LHSGRPAWRGATFGAAARYFEIGRVGERDEGRGRVMATSEEAPREGTPPGADFTKGLPSLDLAEGAMLVGHVGDDAVLLVRASGGPHAVGALCTHYHAPLCDGLLVGETVRCPWHHARFCLKTGAAIGAPAIEPLQAWRVEERDGLIFVRERIETPAPRARPSGPRPVRRIVVVGGGAGGFAAAERLRRDGFDGALTLLSADPAPPYDRPNLSKDYLAGKAPRDWMPMKDRSWYELVGVDLRTGVEVGGIDVRDHGVDLTTGERLAFDALILATGASPMRPSLPGFDDPRVHTLRSLGDCEAIIRAAEGARRVVVIGAGFIGLEVAAALIERGLEVHVAAPEIMPLAHVLGAGLGRFVQSLHEEKGVAFHLGRSVGGFADGAVALDDGTSLPADCVVLGVGVKPRTELAVAAGLKVDKGVVVDSRLETSASGIFAVGDAARYPDLRTGELIRVEHWVAAERQGQHVARVLLGHDKAFTDPPFFWSAHYDVAINYVGHARSDDLAVESGSMARGEATVRFERNGRLMAAATIGRDVESLKIEVGLEAGEE
jgi:NADPH-dependent 2,4-dienoyl-CoA reductase/sulfur reductase-like enzyme/nitrite reductase/ring-hydroxylating ferredoxin subunit